MKKCIECNLEFLEINENFRLREDTGKFDNKCRNCIREYQRIWREKNKDKETERNTNYYITNRDVVLEQSKDYYKNNKEKIIDYKKKYYNENRDKIRNTELKRKYNISLEEYNIILKNQNGCCAICNMNKSLVVDHNHNTGKFRGLLCNNCITALGLLFDNIDYLKSSIKYLENK